MSTAADALAQLAKQGDWESEIAEQYSHNSRNDNAADAASTTPGFESEKPLSLGAECGPGFPVDVLPPVLR